jgi:hypothetical protein
MEREFEALKAHGAATASASFEAGSQEARAERIVAADRAAVPVFRRVEVTGSGPAPEWRR